MNTCQVDNQGRVVVPSRWRQQQGVGPGTELVVLEEDGRLILQTREQAVRQAQEILWKAIPGGAQWSDKLIAERREQARAEAGTKRKAKGL